MNTRNAKAMLSKLKLTDESVGVVVSNDGQGLITVDDFAQVNEKYVEDLCRVLQRPKGNTGGGPIPGLQCHQWLRQTYKE